MLESATILLNRPKGRLYFYLLMDSVADILLCKKKASRKYCKIKSHQSGPGNGRFGFSTSDTRQSDIVSFVCFIQAVAWSFCNAWRICKEKLGIQFCKQYEQSQLKNSKKNIYEFFGLIS